MLTHRTTFWPLMVIHAIGLGCWALGYCSGWVPCISIAAHLALLAYGSATPSSGFFIAMRSSGIPGTLALTYDDGPVMGRTDLLLDLLKQENTTATFFCIGSRVAQAPALAKRIVEEGHTIGVHTQNHSWTWGFMSKRAALMEINECVESIRHATGSNPTLFRAPFGVTSPNTAHAIRESGLQPVAWDLRTFDTIAAPNSSIVEKMRSRVNNATIVLMHDPRPVSLELTKALIDSVRGSGTPLVRLDPE